MGLFGFTRKKKAKNAKGFDFTDSDRVISLRKRQMTKQLREIEQQIKIQELENQLFELQEISNDYQDVSNSDSQAEGTAQETITNVLLSRLLNPSSTSHTTPSNQQPGFSPEQLQVIYDMIPSKYLNTIVLTNTDSCMSFANKYLAEKGYNPLTESQAIQLHEFIKQKQGGQHATPIKQESSTI